MISKPGSIGHLFSKKKYMGVSQKNSGTPKWMVYFMENPIKVDDLGVPLFLETPIYNITHRKTNMDPKNHGVWKVNFKFQPLGIWLVSNPLVFRGGGTYPTEMNDFSPKNRTKTP